MTAPMIGSTAAGAEDIQHHTIDPLHMRACPTAAGGDAYTVSLVPPPDSQADLLGISILVKFPAANTTVAPSLNVNGLGAKTIVKSGSAALSVGDIPTGAMMSVVWDGSNYQLAGGAGGSTSTDDVEDAGTISSLSGVGLLGAYLVDDAGTLA